MIIKKLEFTCIGYIPANNGEVKQYILEVTSHDESKEILAVTPGEIASYTSMKRILLSKKMIYRSTHKCHDEMLLNIFAKPPKVISLPTF